MKFDDLGLSPDVLKAVKECGYDTPTDIQAQAIPQILMTRDVVGLAQTGTGKTAGFILPMIEILHGGRAKARMPRSLVLEPTRELAAQVADNFDNYGKYCGLSKALLVGGEALGEQMKILDRGADVLIATPGRLLDLFERGSVLLSDIKVLVIDEADRMLDMGFIPDIEKIVSLVPPIRQTLLFSATMPPEIKNLSAKFLTNPKTVSVAPPASPAEKVKQSLVWTDEKNKKNVLEDLINRENVKNAFIFCNRKKDVGDLARLLEKKGYDAAPIHGDMPQSARTAVLKRFKDDKLKFLVCSDVVARGIDIAGVSHVFNYDVPMNADDYVHRIGRTGRAGQDGRAWMIAVKKKDDKFVDAIEKTIKKKIPLAMREEIEDSGDGKSDERGNAPPHHKSHKRSGPPPQKKGPKPQNTSQRGGGYPQKEKPSRPRGRPEDDRADKPGFGDDIPAFFK